MRSCQGADRRDGYGPIGKGNPRERGARGGRYRGKQGLNYTPGVSAETVGSRAIWLGTVTLPPRGGRTRAHLHESHETVL